ncbi:hypothetical protein AQ490_03805 [Wenjunlia vitaminophila]|uniref:Uncharacterized protein n=1 Tax=Wenjunlia vitaminophila TaxID=76728 RepID=A0A0T6LT83_WENVI|nr:hypothetical protein [Wenjunlia vitaminophila]KRV49325.1 hypothetical protein AQ490_03805 [Wenjunlia vitaminophila]
MLEERRSGRFVAWGNATIAGLVAPDDAAGKVRGTDTVHHVEGLPTAGGQPSAERVALAWGLGRLRALGVRGFRLALPVPGHPLGLSGPPDFNVLALEAGEAVIAVLSDAGPGDHVRGAEGGGGLGLVPEVTAAGPQGDQHVAVVWRCLPVLGGPPADVPSLAEAERELSQALREATRTLTALDVAGSAGPARTALDALRSAGPRPLLAPGYPGRAVRVLETAQRVASLVGIAMGGSGSGEHGTAITASQVAARTAALRTVERTARRAQTAAYNAYLEERDRGRA